MCISVLFSWPKCDTYLDIKVQYWTYKNRPNVNTPSTDTWVADPKIINDYSALDASRTALTCPLTFTFCHACAIFPEASIRKVAR